MPANSARDKPSTNPSEEPRRYRKSSLALFKKKGKETKAPETNLDWLPAKAAKPDDLEINLKGSKSSTSSNHSPSSQAAEQKDREAGPEVSLQVTKKREYRQRSAFLNYTRAIMVALLNYFPGYYNGIMNPMGNILASRIFKFEKQSEVDAFLGNVNLYFCLGAAISFFLVGPLTDFVGRVRLVLLVGLTAVLITLGYSVESVLMFYVVRTVSGVVTGLLAGVVPVCLSELFPSAVTGVAGCFCYFSGVSFMMLGWLTPFIFDKNEDKMAENYKLIFVLPAAFGLLHFVLMLFLFRFGTLDSPNYFLKKIKLTGQKQKEELKKKLEGWLSCVYVREDVQTIIDEKIEAQLQQQIQAQKQGEKGSREGYGALFTARYRFRFMVVVLINICQQLSGINFLVFFSTQLFDQISNNGKAMTLVIGASNVLGGVVGILTISRFGRRFNLIYGVLVQIAGFSLLIVGYLYKLNIVSIIAVLSYMISFAVGLGGTMPIFCAEILPAAGVGIGGSLQWVFASFVGKFVPVFNSLVGPLWVIVFFIGMMVGTVLFMNYACIETSGLSMQEVEKVYRGEKTSDGRSHHFSLVKVCSSKSGPRKGKSDPPSQDGVEKQ